MIFKHDPEWDERWDELDDFAMGYETAAIPFSAEGYFEEFCDLYEIKNRHLKPVPSEDGFRDTLREVCGDRACEPVAAKTEELFGSPVRITVLEDDRELREELEGPDGLAPFFFVFGMMFCEYEDFTLCFMSGTNN